MLNTLKRNRSALAVAAVAAVILGGGAYAAIPSADGTITACYDAAGNVRLLDTAANASCPTGWQRTSWNQKGQGYNNRGSYDIATDRAGGYKVGDVVTMSNCPQPFEPNSGSYVKVDNVALGAGDPAPCDWVNPNGKTVKGGWMLMTRNGRRGPTGPQGMTGAPGPAYFARVGLNDSNTDRSTWRTKILTWNYGDVIWINTPNLDVTKCAVSVTPISNTVSAHILRSDVTYKDWILLRSFVNGVPTRLAADVQLACPEGDNPSTPNY